MLAICVGEFDCVQTLTKNGVSITVFTPPGKSESGRFALDAASFTLDTFDDFFQTKFPLPKLDMIAIPEFAMGAMEVSVSIMCFLVLCLNRQLLSHVLELGIGHLP